MHEKNIEQVLVAECATHGQRTYELVFYFAREVPNRLQQFVLVTTERIDATSLLLTNLEATI